jgi:phosphoacetylglucosamine mutase
MADQIAEAAKKHPAPEGIKYTYGTAGVSYMLPSFITCC